MDDTIVPRCAVCNTPISYRLYVKSGRTRKFCSRECTIASRMAEAAARSTKACDYCGMPFRAKSVANTKCCSQACARLIAKAKPRNCAYCGSWFSPIRWLENKRRFISDGANIRNYCSTKCRMNHTRSKHHRKCISCGIWFTPVRFISANGLFFPYDACTTCSDACNRAAYPIMEERRKAISKRMAGDNHPNWQGGTHRCGFRGHGWTKLAERIREKADRKCEKCGKPESENGRKLDVNHKKPFHQFSRKADANKESNLEALCRSCHQRTDWVWRKTHPVQFTLPIYKSAA